MNALTILKSDHAHIRWILERLEKGIWGEFEFNKTDYIGWLELLAGVLKEHMKQEEHYLFRFLETAIGKGMQSYHTEEGHADIQQTLGILRGLLHQGGPIPQEPLRTHMHHLIQTLREHMDLEENVIYPRAEKELGYSMLQALGPFMAATN